LIIASPSLLSLLDSLPLFHQFQFSETWGAVIHLIVDQKFYENQKLPHLARMYLILSVMLWKLPVVRTGNNPGSSARAGMGKKRHEKKKRIPLTSPPVSHDITKKNRPATNLTKQQEIR